MCHINSTTMAPPKYVDRKENVLLGNLPDDFLRISQSNSETSPPTSNTIPSQPIPCRNFAPNAHQLTITFIQATLVKNYSLTKMDPYVKVRIGHTVYETQSDIRSGKFPNWNKTITSYLPHGVKTIYIDIFDEKTLVDDERIAHAEYIIPEEVFQGKFEDTWIPLSGKQGEGKEGSLNITICVTPATYPHVMSASNQIVVVPQATVAPMPYYMAGQPVMPYPMVQPMMNPNYMYPAVQQQAQPLPPPSEQDIKLLEDMFPSFDKEVILGVLESSRGNKEHAINSLLALSEN